MIARRFQVSACSQQALWQVQTGSSLFCFYAQSTSTVIFFTAKCTHKQHWEMSMMSTKMNVHRVSNLTKALSTFSNRYIMTLVDENMDIRTFVMPRVDTKHLVKDRCCWCVFLCFFFLRWPISLEQSLPQTLRHPDSSSFSKAALKTYLFYNYF